MGLLTKFGPSNIFNAVQEVIDETAREFGNAFYKVAEEDGFKVVKKGDTLTIRVKYDANDELFEGSVKNNVLKAKVSTEDSESPSQHVRSFTRTIPQEYDTEDIERYYDKEDKEMVFVFGLKEVVEDKEPIAEKQSDSEKEAAVEALVKNGWSRKRARRELGL